MNKEEFITGIEKAVTKNLPANIGQLLEHLPKGNKSLKDLSDWYKSMDISEKKKIEQLIKLAGYHSMFGFLCILDGVRVIEDTIDKGEFELYFAKFGQKELINTETGPYLHDLWKERNLEE